jgi:hypothetical protein
MRKLALIVPCVCFLLLIAQSSFASVQIVYDSNDGWVSKHAADELAKYIKELTSDLPAVSMDAIDPCYQRVFLIGNPNAVVKSKGHLIKELNSKNFSDDGFVIESFKVDDVKFTILAGKTPVSSLYAVYDYLERFCKVGFFEDGEYIPRLSSLPFERANTVQQPFFADRHYLVLFGHWGIKRFHAQFWTIDEWKRELDFLAKKKINMSRMHFRCANDPFQGDVPVLAFPEIGPAPSGYSDSAGWPNTYNWPEDYRKKLTQEILNYGRKLGIRFIYLVAYGDVPVRFKEKHPEIRYLPDDAYGPSTKIHPADPMASEITKKYLKTLINTFGTDHIYFDTPYAETSPGNTAEETVKLKTESSKNLCRILREIDSEAIWYYDAWDFLVVKSWTKDATKKYIESNPIDMTYIADNDAEMSYVYPNNRLDGGLYPMHKIHNYFYGRTWSFGILHSYAGDDMPHGNVDSVINHVKSVAKNPKAAKCKGFMIMPEKIGDNDLYYQLLLGLSWDPLSLRKDEFLKDYIVRRFGSLSSKNMMESLKDINKAFYACDPDVVNYCYYKMTREGMGGYGDAFPVLDGREFFVKRDEKKLVEKMGYVYTGLKKAFKEKENQKGNPLYENYIVEFGKQYFSELSNYFLICAYKDFKAGNKTNFENNSKGVIQSLNVIEKILASRDDYLLTNTIEQAMSVPCTNPATPKLVRQANMNWNYINNDTYEQMRMVYKPRIEMYLNELRTRLNRSIGVLNYEISWSDLSPKFEPIYKEWLNSERLPTPETREPEIVLFIEKSINQINHKSLLCIKNNLSNTVAK